jgi:hypothetical protein
MFIPGKLYRIKYDRFYLNKFPVSLKRYSIFDNRLVSSIDSYKQLIQLKMGDVFMFVEEKPDHHVFLCKDQTYWLHFNSQEQINSIFASYIEQVY